MSIASLVEALQEKYGPQGVRNIFYLAQVVIGVLFVGVLWRLRFGGVARQSGFVVREVDVRKLRKARKNPGGNSNDPLAQARIKKEKPLTLEGISIQAPPHEVLGVRIGATAEEIQKAFRERMKQYHPDKVGYQGSPEWFEAQKLADAITKAKNELLKRAKAKG